MELPMPAMQDIETKVYLGDSVYAQFSASRRSVALTTGNGLSDDPIYLDPDVIMALLTYLRRIGLVEQA
jgi:hypothetical protein